MTMSTYHMGRSWSGHEIEDNCPCEQAECGLIEKPRGDCPEHGWQVAKTMRQVHRAEDCYARGQRRSAVMDPDKAAEYEVAKRTLILSTPSKVITLCGWCSARARVLIEQPSDRDRIMRAEKTGACWRHLPAAVRWNGVGR